MGFRVYEMASALGYWHRHKQTGISGLDWHQWVALASAKTDRNLMGWGLKGEGLKEGLCLYMYTVL